MSAPAESPTPGPVLKTRRLILRPPAAADVEGWLRLMGDPSSHFIGGPQARSQAWRGFMTMAGAWALDGFAMFSIIEQSSGRWIGRAGPWRPPDWPGTEVGWGLLPDACGQGYATEASAAAIDWAFEVLGWSEVIHCIDPANLASQKVAQRLGSTIIRTGRLPAPIDMDVDIWGQTRAQWNENRSSLV